MATLIASGIVKTWENNRIALSERFQVWAICSQALTLSPFGSQVWVLFTGQMWVGEYFITCLRYGRAPRESKEISTLQLRRSFRLSTIYCSKQYRSVGEPAEGSLVNYSASACRAWPPLYTLCTHWRKEDKFLTRRVWYSAAHFKHQSKYVYEISKTKKTFNNGSLGSRIDEERSEMW